MIDRSKIQLALEADMASDILWFADVRGAIREENPQLSKADVRQETLDLVRDFLQREIMCIGKYEITGPTQFRVRRWAISPDEAVRYIDEAWKADADRPLRPGEICEFDRPEDCLPPKDQVD